MQVAIDQALQQDVAAHREGELQEASRLYTAILGSNPNIRMLIIIWVY